MKSKSQRTNVELRIYLQEKSKDELIALMLQLLEEAREPLRLRFWDRIVPAELVTEDLYYSSPEDFLAELKEFVQAVEEGDYFEEEAQEYYDQGSYDHELYDPEYNLTEHPGLMSLEQFLKEADTHFQKQHYDVAASAYHMLITLLLDHDTYETLGVDDPLAEFGQNEARLIERYFLALHRSRPLTEFFQEAINFLARHDPSHRPYLAYFLDLVGADWPQLQTYLEGWADWLEGEKETSYISGIPFQLRLLTQLYTESDKTLALQRRLRHRCYAFYMPLLAEREAAEDWTTVIQYGEEVLAALPHIKLSTPHYYYRSTDRIDIQTIRTQVARAYEAVGEAEKAFKIYAPIFEERQDFKSYIQAQQFATDISPEEGQAFTHQVIEALKEELPLTRYLLSQIYLNEGDFDAPYDLVTETEIGFKLLETTKLLATAYLMAALGSQMTPNMGDYLKQVYHWVEHSEEEKTEFLRDYLPDKIMLDYQTAIERTKILYHQLMNQHLDNDRQDYHNAAYYCALLGEIAAYEGRQEEFFQFYEELLTLYPPHHPLYRELSLKIKNVQ